MLRTCYESLVVFELFNGVVQRFQERVSVESLTEAVTDLTLKKEIGDCFGVCCRFMEGHLHSDDYAYQKPTIDDLKNEVKKYEKIRAEIKEWKKNNKNK